MGTLLSLSSSLITNGIRKTWDTSSTLKSPQNVSESRTISPRWSDSPLKIHTITGKHLALTPISVKYDAPTSFTKREEINEKFESKRERRDFNPKMDKIIAIMNSRKTRMSSPQFWSSPPMAINFRPEALQIKNTTSGLMNHLKERTTPSLFSRNHVQKNDVLHNYPGSHNYSPESRESRDIRVTQYNDDYQMPIFKNIIREHDFDVQIPTNDALLSKGFRSQRRYFPRESQNGFFGYGSYRDDEDSTSEFHDKSMVTSKPRRIIYYAPLPEVIQIPFNFRKNIPYDSLRSLLVSENHSPSNQNSEGISLRITEKRRRPVPYYLDRYKNYVKPFSLSIDHRSPLVFSESERQASDFARYPTSSFYKINPPYLEGKLENLRLNNSHRSPWPLHTNTKLEIRETHKLPGRQIYGQMNNYQIHELDQVKNVPNKEVI